MRYRFQNHDQVYEMTLEREGDLYHATIDGQAYDLQVLDAQPGQISLRFNGRPVTLYWAKDGERKWISVNGCTFLLEKPGPQPARPAEETPGNEAVRAPMPAQVRAIQVAVGDTVDKGRTLLLLEAMKMEIRIKAPRDGQVVRLLVTEGQAVEKDQVLVHID